MSTRLLRSIPIVLSLIFTLSCCAPKYDADTDKQITDLQLNVNQGYNGMITTTKAFKRSSADQKLREAASYKQNAKFYDDTQASLVVLTTRVNQTSKLVDNAKAPLTDIDRIIQRTRDLHEKRGIMQSQGLIEARDDLNTQFATLEGLMQVLKTGSSAGK